MEKMEEMQAAELARHRVDQGAGGYYAKNHGQGPDHSQESLYEEHLTCELLLVHDEQCTAGQHEAVQGRR